MKKTPLYVSRKIVPLIPILLILCALLAGVFTVGATPHEGTLALFDAFDDDPEVSVVKGEETVTCPDWPDFDLKLKITNVTDAVGAVWSIRYDSSLFAIVKADISVPPPADHWLYPVHPDGDIGGLLIDNLAAGVIGEACQIQFATFAPKTFNKTTTPEWGWVATLRFEYTGAAPAIGSPIDTDITIVNDPAPHCASQWTPDGTTWNNFTNLVACHFHYQAIETLTHVVEDFNVVTVSKSIVSNMTLNMTQIELRFNVTGQAGMESFCNVTIPDDLLWVDNLDEWKVIIDGTPLSTEERTVTYNGTHYSIYFTYTHTGTEQVVIKATYVVPEFPPLIFLLLLMIATIATTVVGKKVWSIKRRDIIIAKKDT